MSRPWLWTGIALLALLGLSGCGGKNDPDPTFVNPVADVGNDPYVIEHDGHYFYIESRNGSSLWVTRSDRENLTDLFWSGESVMVWEPPLDGPSCQDLWAPELHLIDDRWFIYYAATTCDGDNANHRMFALESSGTNPLGAYVDRGQVTDETDRWAIDGTTFEEDGQRFFIWSGWDGDEDGQQNLYISSMSDPVTISGRRTLLSKPTEEWEMRGMPILEGPQVIRGPSGKTFVVYSASGSWTDDYTYGLLTLESQDVLDAGSWQKSSDPVFPKSDKVFGAGHGSFVKSPDGSEDWMLYHAARSSGSGWDRVVHAQPFTWSLDGVPDFGKPIPVGVDQAVPSGQVAVSQR